MSAPEQIEQAGGMARGASFQAAASLLIGAAFFLTHGVEGFYGGLQRPLPIAWPLLSRCLVAATVIAWFWAYSRAHRIPWVLDLGWFLMGAWMLLVPYFVIRREGRAGLQKVGLLALTYFAAWATGLAIRIWIRVLTTD